MVQVSTILAIEEICKQIDELDGKSVRTWGREVLAEMLVKYQNPVGIYLFKVNGNTRAMSENLFKVNNKDTRTTSKTMSHHRSCYACHHQNRKDEDTFKLFPDKSKDVLDIRIVPGDPNQAWIECYDNTFDEHAQKGMAELNAVREFRRMKECASLKEKKLKKVQHDVAARVNYIRRLRQEGEKRKVLQLIEDEEFALQQRIRGMRIPYKGNVENLKALNNELLKPSSVLTVPSLNTVELDEEEQEKSKKLLNSNIVQKKIESVKARNKMLAKKLQVSTTELPGGLWESHGNNKENSVHIFPPKRLQLLNQPIPKLDTWTGSNTIKHIHNNYVKEGPSVDGKESLEYPATENLKNSHTGLIEDKENNEIEKNEKSEIEINEEECNHFLDSYVLGPFQRNLVCDPAIISQEKDIRDKQKRSQYWKLRKLFMEIEREQVQQKRRQNEQDRKMQRLKLRKEETRMNEEERRVADSTILFKELPECLPDESKERNETCDSVPLKHENKRKEMRRYMEALREVARERHDICNIQLPPLCQCGPTLWDSHPDTCANNCIFYKNVKGYVNALTSVLANTRR